MDDALTNEMEMQMDMDIYSVVQDVELTHVQNNCEYFMSSSSLHLEHGLSILHINARSLMNKLDMFHTFLNNTGVKWSLICISETWFNTRTGVGQILLHLFFPDI